MKLSEKPTSCTINRWQPERVVYVEEIKLERLEESIKVYNLEVEGLHTYYVGSVILVHNAYQNGDSGNDTDSVDIDLK